MGDKAVSGFVWYELMTSDLDAAVAFYRDAVGWDVRDSGMPGMRYMIFGKGGKDVGGMSSWADMGQAGKPPKWVGHLFTPDVDAATAAVVADGGQQWRAPQDIPGVGRFSVMSDPQGAEILLFQPSQTGDAPSRLRPQEPGAVGWHELATTDWERAWEFYSRHFGWTKSVAVDMGPTGTYQTFTMDEGSGGGMMNLPPGVEGNSMGPAWLFYFTVEDIQRAAQEVRNSGGTVTHGPAQVPGGGWIVQGTDPQGAAFAVTAAK